MKYEIAIPLRYLLAVRLFAAKEAARPYLNGVAFTDQCLVATNGRYCAAIDLGPDAAGYPEVIIPSDAIDFFAKKHGRRGMDKASVMVSWEADGLLQLVGRSGITEQSKPLEGQFPPFRRIMVVHTEAVGHPQFPWDQVALFEKAAETLGTSRANLHKTYLIPNGRRAAARIVLPNHPEFNGVLMPLEPREVDKLFPALAYPAEELKEDSLV